MAYCQESVSQTVMFRRAGWGDGLMDPPADMLCRTWGWAGHFATRDWEAMMYRVLVVTNELSISLKSGDCNTYTVFFPLSDVQPFSTSADSFVYGMEGFEAADFRSLASTPHQPGGSSEDPTPSEGTSTSGGPKAGVPGETKPGSSNQNTPPSTAATTAQTASSMDRSVTNAPNAAGLGTSDTAATCLLTPTTPTLSTGAAPSSTTTSTTPVSVDPKQKPKLGTDKKAADANPDHRAAPLAT